MAPIATSKLEYKDIFQSLLNFRKMIKNNDFIFALPERHKNIKSNQLYEMFKYLFPRNDIRVLNINKITPKNREEIDLILRENHDSKLSGHYGFNKTYSKIKASYNWLSKIGHKTVREKLQIMPNQQNKF